MAVRANQGSRLHSCQREASRASDDNGTLPCAAAGGKFTEKCAFRPLGGRHVIIL